MISSARDSYVAGEGCLSKEAVCQKEGALYGWDVPSMDECGQRVSSFLCREGRGILLPAEFNSCESDARKRRSYDFSDQSTF